MSALPTDRYYAATHEWVYREQDGTLTIGITDYAQEALGDIVFIELPEIGRALAADESCAVIESVKAASELYAPVAGKIIAVHAEVADTPERVNEEPYATWLFKLQPDSDALDGLLDAAGYEAQIA